MPRKRCRAGERQCPVCGKSEIRKLGEKTVWLCSRECSLERKKRLAKTARDKWRLENPILPVIPRVCPECGVEFTPHVFVRNKARFCSRRCKRNNLAKSQYWRDPEYRERHSQRNRRWREASKWNGNWWKALLRDNFTCGLCGKVGSENSINSRSILVHHLDGEGETGANNHGLENLMTVCYDCHEGLHGISLVKEGSEWVLRGKILELLHLRATVKS